MKTRKLIGAVVSLAILFASRPSLAGQIVLEDDPPGLGSEPSDQIPKFEIVPGPSAAVMSALEDVRKLPEPDQQFMRYNWVPPWGDNGWIGAVNYAANAAVSRSQIIIPITQTGNGYLTRFDLRMFADSDREVEALALRYGGLAALDSYFHVTVVDSNNQKVIGFNAGAGVAAMKELSARTASFNPIMRADNFIARTLTTLEGGQYYELVGVPRGKGKQTDEEAFFDLLGVEKGTLDATQKTAMFFSGVHGKVRVVDLRTARNTRPGTAASILFETHDPSDEQIDVESDPVRNLVTFVDSAREAIAFRRNGLQIFALYKADGSLQRSAPDNVVRDSLVPAPFTSRLQPPMGCIRCHGGNSGLQPLKNDVTTMLAIVPALHPSIPVNVFGDLSLASKQSTPAQLQLLAGLYAGNLDKPLDRARDDYNEAVWRATGGMTVVNLSAKIAAIYAGYRYTLVSPAMACRELGVQVSEADGQAMFGLLVARIGPDETGIGPDDPIVIALRRGISVQRYQFEGVYADLLARSSGALQHLQKIAQQRAKAAAN